MGDRTRQGFGQQVANPNGVPSSRTLTGAAPITIDGDNAAHDLSADITIAIVPATDVTGGYMTAADHATLTGLANNAGKEIKGVVRAAAQGNLAGTRIGNVITLTALAVLVKATVDIGWVSGPALSVGDRLLLPRETSAVDNGIYTVTTLGTLGLLGATLTRAADMASSADVQAGMVVPVGEGTDANRRYELTIPDDPAPVLNTDNMTFAYAATADISTATPQAVGTATAGTSNTVSAGDHVHAHGNQVSDTNMHAAVIAAGASGFMTGSDKTKLDTYPASGYTFEYSPVDSRTAVDTAGNLTVGVAFVPNRAMHCVGIRVGIAVAGTYSLKLWDGNTGALLQSSVGNVVGAGGVATFALASQALSAYHRYVVSIWRSDSARYNDITLATGLTELGGNSSVGPVILTALGIYSAGDAYPTTVYTKLFSVEPVLTT